MSATTTTSTNPPTAPPIAIPPVEAALPAIAVPAGGLPAVVTLPAPAVAASHPNPFRAIALLMRTIADSMENPNAAGRPPRYVRIARLRSFLTPVAPKDETVAKAIGTGVGYFVLGMGYIQKYSLKAEALLTQGDAGKALFETAADLLDTVADPEFFNAISTVVDGPRMDSSPLAPMRGVISDARRIVGRIPEPEDLGIIGAQIYRLMAVEQLPVPAGGTLAPTETAHIDMTRTGKLRLMLWALNKPFRPIETGPVDSEVTTFGMRRLRQGTADQQSRLSRGTWTGADGEVETVFETSFAAPTATPPGVGGADVRELKTLLKNLGYFDAATVVDDAFDDQTTLRLRQFQHVNGLKVTGLLDNPTVNGLLNLSYHPDPQKGGMRLARPFNPAALNGFDPNAKA